MVIYGRCELSGMDGGDGNAAAVGLWLMVSLVPPRPSKVPDSANKSSGGRGRVTLTRGPTLPHERATRSAESAKVFSPNILTVELCSL